MAEKKILESKPKPPQRSSLVKRIQTPASRLPLADRKQNVVPRASTGTPPVKRVGSSIQLSDSQTKSRTSSTSRKIEARPTFQSVFNLHRAVVDTGKTGRTSTVKQAGSPRLSREIPKPRTLSKSPFINRLK